MLIKLKNKKPKKKEKISKWVEDTLTTTKKTTQRNVEKKYRVRFNNAWFVTTIKAINEQLHKNFRVRFRAQPLGHRRFGLGVTSQQQKIAKVQRRKKNAICWTSTDQITTFHSTTMKGKGLNQVLMAKGKENKIQKLS